MSSADAIAAKAEAAVGKVNEKAAVVSGKVTDKVRDAREKIHKHELAQKAIKKAFAECDIDGSGKLSAAELYVGILLVYDKINKVCPVHIQIPKKKEVMNMMKKHDIDTSGELTEEEFDSVAMDLVAGHGDSWKNAIWFRVTSAVALKLLIFPAVGWGLKEGITAAGCPAIQKVPTAVLAMASEVAYKVGVMKVADIEE